MLGVEALPAVFYFFLLFLVPESPRWLIGRGRGDEARGVLLRAIVPEEAPAEFDRIRESFARQSGGGGVLRLFSRSMRFVMFIALSIAFFQQITGINAILYYAPIIFAMAGGGREASLVQAALVGLVNLVATPVSMWLVDRWGRKPLLILGAAGMAVSLAACSWAFSASRYELTPAALEQLAAAKVPADLLVRLQSVEGRAFATESQFTDALQESVGGDHLGSYQKALCAAGLSIPPRQACVVLWGILGFVASFAVSIGGVMWVLLAEIFPNDLRGKAISLAGFWGSLVSFSVTAVFPWAMANWGTAVTYATLAVFAILSLLFVAAFVPETKGKTLEEIEYQLVG